jgi:hypothetical protein
VANIFNEDFKDFISLLNKREVEYILVGGYAVILHGYRRTTGDLDIWVNRTKDNFKKLVKVYRDFGLHEADMTEQNFLDAEKFNVFTYGVPPVCIEILTQLKDCEFTQAYALSQIHNDDGLAVRFLHLSTLITSKQAVGRYRDLDDLEKLSQL